MPSCRIVATLSCLLVLSPAWGTPQGDPSRLLLDDFEKEPAGWKFIGGEEFPGARGSLASDPTLSHAGKASYRLQADFTGGGAYIGTWRDLASLKGKDFKELRFWAKTSTITQLGVRLLDSSDQIHQSALPLAATPEWQEVVLSIAKLVGGEHWGGANDGKWHGPVKGFGLNIGKTSVAPAASGKGILWMDDLEALPGSPIEGHPTIHAAVVSPGSCRPGFGVRVTYRWDAEPLGRDINVFVHFTGSKGMAFQGDHGPTPSTSVWTGKVEYSKMVAIPLDLAEGEYKIIAGLWDFRSGKRIPLKGGEGAISAGADAFQVGVIKVDANAPLPKLPAPTLKLDAFKLTWSDEFSDLSVSSRGPGTRWIAHTPSNTDFGDARFADPKDGVPFSVENGILRIEAAKEGNRWRAGLLSSVDPKGDGFSQKYGYFEMRSKFPKGPGMWPAFWLLGVPALKNRSLQQIEVDVVEQYGAMPNALCMTLHLWGPGDKHWGEGDASMVQGMTDDFHNYGVLIEEKEIVWYFDGIELWRQKTPEAAKVPLYVLVDLAMGGGWPIDKAVSPSYMYVDYVRVYARK
jgi:hypothetical protein